MRLAADVDAQRREVADPEVAGEHPRDAGFEVVRVLAREEADPAEVDAEHRHAGAEERAQRAEHRPVAAEDDCDVRIVGGIDQLHADLRGDLAEPVECVADRARLAVRDDGRARDLATRPRRRFRHRPPPFLPVRR